MLKSLSTLTLAALAAGFFVASAQQPTIKNVPLQQTSVTNGQQMYTSYCASCHGATGLGNGPAAPALKVPPANLTVLTQKNGGVFPDAHVFAVLQFGVENPAHGNATMPIWGNLLPSLSPGAHDPETLTHQRIVNISAYLKKLQK